MAPCTAPESADSGSPTAPCRCRVCTRRNSLAAVGSPILLQRALHPASWVPVLELELKLELELGLGLGRVQEQVLVPVLGPGLVVELVQLLPVETTAFQAGQGRTLGVQESSPGYQSLLSHTKVLVHSQIWGYIHSSDLRGILVRFETCRQETNRDSFSDVA